MESNTKGKTMGKIIIEDSLDDEGYPSEEYIKFIKDWEPKVCPFHDLFNSFLSAWRYKTDAYKIHHDSKVNGVTPVEFHTLGWSGNEEIINAIFENIYITHVFMRYRARETGGHYYFVLTDKDYDMYTASTAWRVKLQIK